MKQKWIALAIVLLAAAGAFAQGRFFGGFGGPRVRNFKPYPNSPYDGRFNFVRVVYECDASGYWWRGMPSWAHGYPTAEQNLIKIMNEVSYFGAQDGINTLRMAGINKCLAGVTTVEEIHRCTVSDRS